MAFTTQKSLVEWTVGFEMLNAITVFCRMNVLDALESLPEPEETAQTMVVRQSSQPSTRKRRGSISQYFKRKWSKRKDGPSTHYDVSASTTPEAVSQRSPRRKSGYVSIQEL